MNIYFKTLSLILFSIFLVKASEAQDLVQVVRGKVVDQQSGSPIVGANVIILGTSPLLGATTNVDGQFRISNVPLGRQNIKVSFIGYEESNLPEVLVSTGKEVVLTISLRESFVAMDEIVIRASDQEKGKPLNDMALISAQSFSVEETSRYAATFDDPARAALSLPGVTGGGDDGTNEIVIRGNSPRGVLWRIEGVEVPNPNHFAEEGSSAGAVSMLSNNMLSNSDFFTGAFPAEYGNALSGVFDINLRQGNNETREYAFQAGLLGLAFAAEGPFSKNSKGSYLVNYRYSTVDLFDKIGVEVIAENEAVTFQDFSFKFHLPTKNLGTFSLWGVGGASDYRYKANPEDGDYFDEDSQNRMGAFGLSNIFYFNENTYLKSILSYSILKNRFLEDSLSQRIDTDDSFNHDALRASILLNQKFNSRNTLKSGIILSQLGYDLTSKDRNFRTNELVTEVATEGSTQLVQLYSQWQHRLKENLIVNSGLHFSYFALNGNTSIEPRASFRWQFKSNQAITGGFGIHSRLEPISLYLAQDQLEDGSTVQPNKNLNMTKAAHYVIGYEMNLKPDLKLKSEIYYQSLFDVPIRPDFVTAPWERIASALNSRDGYTTDTLVNNGSGRNYGIELTLEKYFTNNYYFLITGSVFESKYKGAENVERNTRFNSNHVANIIVGKEFKVGKAGNNTIGVNARVIWSGGQRTIPINLEASIAEGRTVYEWNRPFEEKLPNYFRMDIGLRYRKNKPNHASIIALNVQNFTGRYNVLDQYFSRSTGTIRTDEQLGLFPNISYRIEF